MFRSVHTFVCPVRQALCPGRACQGALAVMAGWEEVVDPVGTGSHHWDREWGDRGSVVVGTSVEVEKGKESSHQSRKPSPSLLRQGSV